MRREIIEWPSEMTSAKEGEKRKEAMHACDRPRINYTSGMIPGPKRHIAIASHRNEGGKAGADYNEKSNEVIHGVW